MTYALHMLRAWRTNTMTSFTASAASLWKTLQAGFSKRLTRPRSLLLRESLSLGERRFAAVIECDGQRFLIGGGKESVQLIACLPPIAKNATKETE
jgi:flagellar biogenesis protein FliO